LRRYFHNCCYQDVYISYPRRRLFPSDSSGLGELVKAYTTVRNQGGQLKLVNPSKRVQDLLQMTKLSAVFTIEADEASAIQSFSDAPGSKAVA